MYAVSGVRNGPSYFFSTEIHEGPGLEEAFFGEAQIHVVTALNC